MPNSDRSQRVTTRATSCSAQKGKQNRRTNSRGPVVGLEGGTTTKGRGPQCLVDARDKDLSQNKTKKRTGDITSNNCTNKRNKNDNNTHQILSLENVVVLNTSTLSNRIQLSTNATATASERRMDEGCVREETSREYDDDDSCKEEEEKSLLALDTDLIQYFSTEVALSRWEKKLFNCCVRVYHKHGFECSIMGLARILLVVDNIIGVSLLYS